MNQRDCGGWVGPPVTRAGPGAVVGKGRPAPSRIQKFVEHRKKPHLCCKDRRKVYPTETWPHSQWPEVWFRLSRDKVTAHIDETLLARLLPVDEVCTVEVTRVAEYYNKLDTVVPTNQV